MKDIYLIEKDMIIQKEKALHTKDRTKILLKMNQETRLINIYTFWFPFQIKIRVRQTKKREKKRRIY